MTVSAPPSDLAPRLAGLTLAEIEVPNGREEEWRFTPLKRLAGLQELTSAPAFVSFSVDAPAGVEVSEADIDSRMHHFIEQATEEIYAGQ